VSNNGLKIEFSAAHIYSKKMGPKELCNHTRQKMGTKNNEMPGINIKGVQMLQMWIFARQYQTKAG
jgi:hypothetical protein